MSPPSTVCDPESPVNVQDVEILAVEAAVILPCASTVNTGIAVELPYEAAVTAVSSRFNVTPLPEPTELSPVPPAIVNVSLSKSIASAPPLSPWKSKSCPVTAASTYAFTDCCVGTLVAESEAILSSSTKVTPEIVPSLNDVPSTAPNLAAPALPVITELVSVAS